MLYIYIYIYIYIQSTPDIKNQEIHKDLFFITEVLYKRSVC